MKKKFIPNAALPKGATMLKRVQELKIGAYYPQKFDARVDLFGVRFYRVHKGWNQEERSEVWIADTPIGLCISEYEWNDSGSIFPKKADTFVGAVKIAIECARNNAVHRMEEFTAKAQEMAQCVEKLNAALAKARKPSVL
jgi:hypothetical protein